MVEYGGGGSVGVSAGVISACAAAVLSRWRSGVEFLCVLGDFTTISSSERGKWSYSNSSEVRLLRFTLTGDLGSGVAVSEDKLFRACPSSTLRAGAEGSMLVPFGAYRLPDLVVGLVASVPLLASGESVRVLVGERERIVVEVRPM